MSRLVPLLVLLLPACALSAPVPSLTFHEPLDASLPIDSGTDAGIDAAARCECASGPCCDGCHLRPSSYVCAHDVPVNALCSLAETWPSGCRGGASITVQYGDHYCSGRAPVCDGIAAPTGREETTACDPSGTDGPSPILCRQAPPLGAECAAWCGP